MRSSFSLSLGANLENLILSGTAAINGTGNALANRLTGNSAANVLNGGAGADMLVGGAGADTLVGGAGRDFLHGGPADGATDVFVFNSVTDSANGAAVRDVVYHFVSGIDDISLTGIDANRALVGNQAFSWAATTPTANAVWFAVSGLNILVRGDINGDAGFDFEIQIMAASSVTAGDVFL